MELKGVLFDLDGVITDTAKFHFEAWKTIAKKLDIELKPSFNEQLKGIDRYNSLMKILKLKDLSLTENEINSLLAEKNSIYVEYLKTLEQKDILPSILDLLKDLKRNNIKVSIASISQNAPFILEKLELLDYVDAIANPKEVQHSKPAPDIFIEAARLIDVEPQYCIGIEDAEAGVEAIRRANIVSVGVGVKGDVTLPDTSELSLSLLRSIEPSVVTT